MGDDSRNIGVSQFPGEHCTRQEMALEEIAEGIADAVLVGRDDRGVRDAQAQRVAKQGGHSKPVSQTAHQGRLGKRAQP